MSPDPRSDDAGLDLDPATFELVRRYQEVGRVVEQGIKERQELRDRLVARMGGGTVGRYDGRRVLIVVRTRPRRFDGAAFSEAHPALYEQFRTESAEPVIRLIIEPDLPRSGGHGA